MEADLSITRTVLFDLLGQTAWLLIVVIGAACIFVLLRFMNWRLKRSFQAVAQINSINFHYLKDDDLELDYEFRYRGKLYTGKGRLSISSFAIPSESIKLTIHSTLDLPVLYFRNSVYVGDEAIEYTLLSMRSTLRIRFLSADPSRNFLVPEFIPVSQSDRQPQNRE
ncbi:MAG: hypothetical protein H3C43_10670 [Leptonema sp. (in: Bacteria)]|nr:hypothetical protein [Leptonema sp. (in: bacteria)]